MSETKEIKFAYLWLRFATPLPYVGQKYYVYAMSQSSFTDNGIFCEKSVRKPLLGKIFYEYSFILKNFRLPLVEEVTILLKK